MGLRTTLVGSTAGRLDGNCRLSSHKAVELSSRQ
jgi:hypothetical protein